MEKLTVDQLHVLRLRIFDNAESLHKEAKLLLDNGFYARAFLLSYFTCEELGKIPIVVGTIGRMLKNEAVDWKKAIRRFRDHKAKVDSDDFHQYVFGIELDLLRDLDLKWLEAAKVTSKDRVNHKNNSTYVDVQGAAVILGCCRFQRHRVRCMKETGGRSWSDGSLRESSKLRR